jgi:AcrR family transcriptional regulator
VITYYLGVVASTEPRQSAAERRETILAAAMVEFAERGLHGTSTEAIAKRAGISQPYLFRLFGTKKELFAATVTRCFRETLDMFQRAAEGKRGEEALSAMGSAYNEKLQSDRTRLRVQMQAYNACDDAEICELVRNGYGDLVAYVERVSGLPTEEIGRFFATGMLLNVFASMKLDERPEPWSEALMSGCKPA